MEVCQGYEVLHSPRNAFPANHLYLNTAPSRKPMSCVSLPVTPCSPTCLHTSMSVFSDSVSPSTYHGLHQEKIGERTPHSNDNRHKLLELGKDSTHYLAFNVNDEKQKHDEDTLKFSPWVNTYLINQRSDLCGKQSLRGTDEEKIAMVIEESLIELDDVQSDIDEDFSNSAGTDLKRTHLASFRPNSRSAFSPKKNVVAKKVTKLKSNVLIQQTPSVSEYLYVTLKEMNLQNQHKIQNKNKLSTRFLQYPLPPENLTLFSKKNSLFTKNLQSCQKSRASIHTCQCSLNAGNLEVNFPLRRSASLTSLDKLQYVDDIMACSLAPLSQHQDGFMRRNASSINLTNPDESATYTGRILKAFQQWKYDFGSTLCAYMHNVMNWTGLDGDEFTLDQFLPESSCVTILGQTFHHSEDSKLMRNETPTVIERLAAAIRSLTLMTYRRDFAPMYRLFSYQSQHQYILKITSDAGWGCMVRCSQMLLFQTLKNYALHSYIRLQCQAPSCYDFHVVNNNDCEDNSEDDKSVHRCSCEQQFSFSAANSEDSWSSSGSPSLDCSRMKSVEATRPTLFFYGISKPHAKRVQCERSHDTFKPDYFPRSHYTSRTSKSTSSQKSTPADELKHFSNKLLRYDLPQSIEFDILRLFLDCPKPPSNYPFSVYSFVRSAGGGLGWAYDLYGSFPVEGKILKTLLAQQQHNSSQANRCPEVLRRVASSADQQLVQPFSPIPMQRQFSLSSFSQYNSACWGEHEPLELTSPTQNFGCSSNFLTENLVSGMTNQTYFLGKRPGDRFGPFSASYALKYLVETTDLTKDKIGIYINSEGLLDTQSAISLMIKKCCVDRDLSSEIYDESKMNFESSDEKRFDYKRSCFSTELDSKMDSFAVLDLEPSYWKSTKSIKSDSEVIQSTRAHDDEWFLINDISTSQTSVDTPAVNSQYINRKNRLQNAKFQIPKQASLIQKESNTHFNRHCTGSKKVKEVSEHVWSYSDQEVTDDSGCKGLLICFPLTLGKQLSKEQQNALSEYMDLIWFNGMIGSRNQKKQALYFIGKHEQTNNLIEPNEGRKVNTEILYLDPHLVQASATDLALSWHTFHNPKVYKTALSTLDPSLLLSFYCHSFGDLYELVQELTEIARRHQSRAPLRVIDAL